MWWLKTCYLFPLNSFPYILPLPSSSPFVLPLRSLPSFSSSFPPLSSPFFLRYNASSGNICVYGFNDGLPSLVERIITALDPLNDNPLCILNDPLLQRRFPQIMERRLRSKRNFTKVNRLIVPLWETINGRLALSPLFRSVLFLLLPCLSLT